MLLHGLRSQGWFVADGLVGADHVLVGDAGVLVVQVMRSDGSPLASDAPVRARIAARRLHHELAVRELPVEVVPAVLACGPGQPDVPGGVRVVDGVAYLFDDRAPEWLEHLASRRLLAGEVVDAVREIVADLLEGVGTSVSRDVVAAGL